jgi:hypothetical protein
MMRHPPFYPITLLLLAACAAPGTTQAPDPGARVTQALTSPLADLNLTRPPIPPVLVASQQAPYRLPAILTCASLASEVRELNAALGPDLDATRLDLDPNLFERGTTAVGEAAFDAIEGAAQGVVPFRRWVRKLSGAERYSKDVAAAVGAGIIRRAFLKGVGEKLGCLPPAAPIRPEEPNDFLSGGIRSAAG